MKAYLIPEGDDYRINFGRTCYGILLSEAVKLYGKYLIEYVLIAYQDDEIAPIIQAALDKRQLEINPPTHEAAWKEYDESIPRR